MTLGNPNFVTLSNAAAFERVRDGIITHVRVAARGPNETMYVEVDKGDRLALVARLDELGLSCRWDPTGTPKTRGRGRGGTIYVDLW